MMNFAQLMEVVCQSQRKLLLFQMVSEIGKILEDLLKTMKYSQIVCILKLVGAFSQKPYFRFKVLLRTFKN